MKTFLHAYILIIDRSSITAIGICTIVIASLVRVLYEMAYVSVRVKIVDKFIHGLSYSFFFTQKFQSKKNFQSLERYWTLQD